MFQGQLSKRVISLTLGDFLLLKGHKQKKNILAGVLTISNFIHLLTIFFLAIYTIECLPLIQLVSYRMVSVIEFLDLEALLWQVRTMLMSVAL